MKEEKKFKLSYEQILKRAKSIDQLGKFCAEKMQKEYGDEGISIAILFSDLCALKAAYLLETLKRLEDERKVLDEFIECERQNYLKAVEKLNELYKFLPPTEV